MLKYVILILINLPLIGFGILSTLTSYKTKKITVNKCRAQIMFWVLLAVGLFMIQPAYDFLVTHNLTDSAPMSMFDIVLLTGIIFSLLFIKHTREKLDLMNDKFSRLHENIIIAEHDRNWDK